MCRHKAGPAARTFLWVFGFAVAACGQGVDQLAHAYQDSPSAKTRAALAQYADRNPTTVDGALASLALGASEAESGDVADALRRLSQAQRRLPALADYIAYWMAQVHVRASNSTAAVPALEPVWRAPIPSPVTGKAAALGAKALLDLEQPKAALALLSKYGDQLNQPQGYWLLGQAEEAAGNKAAAAAWYQSVYYGYPLTPEAPESKQALARLQAAMGDQYPPAMPRIRLERTTKLLEMKQYALAKSEFMALANDLGGAERDLARIRAGGADYLGKRTQVALSYLKDLKVSTPEADAERLYYLLACQRRLDKDGEVQSILGELAGKYPTSPWRLKALTLSATAPFVENDPGGFVPIYRACYESFPSSADAAMCHWRVTWNLWIQRKPEALAMLKEHLQRYPASEKANAALYFLGRYYEQTGDMAAAKRFYQEVPVRYPNSYYTLQVRNRLKNPAIEKAGLSQPATDFLASIPMPQRFTPEFQPNAASAQRIERAKLLSRAGLTAWSDGELRYAARRDGQPFVMAMELAELSAQRGETPRGLRHLKGAANGYLGLPFEAAPEKFWKLAFPFPYRAAITARAKENNVDPYLVAGLIRQESEFDPKVVSYARAIGLTQVMPGTGRELSRKVGLKGYNTARLKDADTNLRLGTYYLKSILDSFDGRVEPTLASYNAGKSRADRWLTWADYREPAEFIENIPFNQTREYVQILLRNADVYRRLYEKEPIPVQADGLPKEEKKASGEPPGKTKPVSKPRKPAKKT